MSLTRILAVIRARNREFYRDKAGLGWNLLMPLLILFGFAFMFSGGPRDQYKVGLLGERLPETNTSPFLATRHIQFIPVADLQAGIAKVRQHGLDLLLVLDDPPRYWINDQSANGYLVERLLRSAYQDQTPALSRETVSGRETRYVDWLVPGVLTMNIMFSCLWGVGWVIVRYRKNGVLRRLRATPLTALEFLVAQVLSRLLVVFGANGVVFLGTYLLLDFPLRGSLVALLLIFLAGALCLISLGLLIASRVRSEELADGLLNLMSWPMMVLSGIWFSMEGTHPLARLVSQGLPTTHLVDGARRIMLEGAGLAEMLPSILLLAGLGLILLTLAARLFRWQ